MDIVVGISALAADAVWSREKAASFIVSDGRSHSIGWQKRLGPCGWRALQSSFLSFQVFLKKGLT